MASERIMRLAAEAARKDIAQLLSMLQRIGPLPDAFWRDPYVIGYLASVGGMVAEDVTDGRLSEKHLTKASFLALAALAGKKPEQLRTVVENGTPDSLFAFEDGFFAACKVAAVASGSDEFDDDSAVVQARAFVSEHKAAFDQDGATADERARTVAVLESALFVTYVAEAYYPEAVAGLHRLPQTNP